MLARLDMYTGIHQGLRANMYETGLLLSRTNFADEAERGAAIAAVTTSLGFLDEHVIHEDTFLAPVFKDISPALGDTIGDQHGGHERESAEIKATAARLREGGGDPLAEGAKLCAQYNHLIADHMAHMSLEETKGNAALWAHRTDDQLREVHAGIQGSMPPERFAEYLKIMVPNMNYQELTGMLGGIKATAPPPVFEMVSGLARECLGDRWPAIEAAL